MELKPFDKFDWYGFAGAERFADGSEPLIGSTHDRVVIADEGGIQVIFMADDSVYDFQTPNAKAVAAMLLLDVVAPEGLVALGFERLN